MHLIQFKSEEIDKVWPLVKDKIQEALNRNFNPKDHWHVKEQCKLGLEQLWVIVDDKDDIHGVCVSSIVKQPNYNVGIVNMATGHDLSLWVDQIKEFEKWASKNYGVKKIEIFGRPGWKKMLAPLGFTFSHVQMDKFIGGVH
jgi:hypothetical protein